MSGVGIAAKMEGLRGTHIGRCVLVRMLRHVGAGDLEMRLAARTRNYFRVVQAL